MLVVGLHLVEGFCVQFPAQVDGQALETWEDWSESDFLAEEGEIESAPPVSQSMLTEAQDVLRDAEDGCHLHFHEDAD